MSYAFPELDTSKTGAVYQVPVPLGKYLDASYDEGVHYTALHALNRMSEMSLAEADDSPMITAKDATERFAVGNMKFTEPVRESVARIMNRRKRDEMDRAFFLDQGSSKARFIPGMAASMLGSISNPVDLGLMFVPFVGSEEMAAKAVGTAGKLMARRLVTREVLAETFPRAPFLTESVINGVVGQTMFEVPALVAASQDQSDYGFANSAMNIAAGGALSAAFHGLGRLLGNLSRDTQHTMVKEALNQYLKDENISVFRYVDVDEHAIWEKVKFNEDEALSRAYDKINVEDIAVAVREKYGENVESPAIQLADGTIHVGPDHAAIREEFDLTPYTREGELKPGHTGKEIIGTEGFKTDKGRFVSRDEAGQLVGLPDKGYNHEMFDNDKLVSEQISTVNPEQLGTAEYDRYNQIMEENPHATKVDALKQIMADRERRRNRFLMEQPHIKEAMEVERKAAIAKFIEDERVKFEQTKQGKFNELKQKEIERQIAEGKTMSPEEIQKNSPPEKFEEGAEGDLDKDIGALKKDLKVDEESAKIAKEAKDKNILEQTMDGIDKLVKSLDHDPTKMSLPLADLLTLGIGRPVLKGLLLAVKEGLKLTNDLAKAIDYAMEWYKKQTDASVKAATAFKEGDRLKLPVVDGHPEEMGKIIGIDVMRRADGQNEHMFTVETEAGDMVEVSYDTIKSGMQNADKVRQHLEQAVKEEVVSANKDLIFQGRRTGGTPNPELSWFSTDYFTAREFGKVYSGQPPDMKVMSEKEFNQVVKELKLGPREFLDFHFAQIAEGKKYTWGGEGNIDVLYMPKVQAEVKKRGYNAVQFMEPEGPSVGYLGKLDLQEHVPQTKAIEAAVDCLLRKMV